MQCAEKRRTHGNMLYMLHEPSVIVLIVLQYWTLQHLFPVGLSDVVDVATVKLYCPRCRDVYLPKATRHMNVDGAYFGTSSPHMMFMVHPDQLPRQSTNQFTAKLYGFKIHPEAYQLQQVSPKSCVAASSVK